MVVTLALPFDHPGDTHLVWRMRPSDKVKQTVSLRVGDPWEGKMWLQSQSITNADPGTKWIIWVTVG